jgi:hypothetical protein
MKGKYVSIAPLLALSAVVAMSPLNVQAKPAHSEEIAPIRAGQTVVEGVVTQMKSGLYTVKTATGTNYTLAESGAVRYGGDAPKVGDEMILWINEGNDIMDARKKGVNNLSPRFISGKLVSINYGRYQITLSMAGGEENFELRPESLMFREFAVGTPVTIALNREGEVIDIHIDKDAEVPRSGESALKGFRHLGEPQ